MWSSEYATQDDREITKVISYIGNYLNSNMPKSYVEFSIEGTVYIGEIQNCVPFNFQRNDSFKSKDVHLSQEPCCKKSCCPF